MKSLKLFITILFASQFLLAQDYAPLTHYCYYQLDNYSGEQAILYALKGDQTIALDTTKVQRGAFVFSNIEKYPAGMYRISFNDTLFTELVFNNEDIVLKADARSVLLTMQVKRSDENMILFTYWVYAMQVRDSIVSVGYEREKFKKSSNYSVSKVQAYDDRIETLNEHLYEYIEGIAAAYPNLLTPVILRSYLIPSYSHYLKDKDNEPYPSERMFYLYHFFDNIDFSDARLLNTRIIYTAISDYMRTFAKPAKSSVYNDIIDRVMDLSKSNDSVYRYSLSLFIRTFENSIWENVYVRIIEKYYFNSVAFTPQQGKYYTKKIAIIKSLRLGEKMPNVVLNDTTNNSISLYSVKSKVKMVLIYSSSCPHCKEVMPDVKEVYNTYKSMGFEIYAIAIDDSASIWKKEIVDEHYNWISVSDLKGLNSPVLDTYNVWMTPMMYMLDKNNIIVNKPRGMEDIHATILQLLKMK